MVDKTEWNRYLYYITLKTAASFYRIFHQYVVTIQLSSASHPHFSNLQNVIQLQRRPSSCAPSVSCPSLQRPSSSDTQSTSTYRTKLTAQQYLLRKYNLRTRRPVLTPTAPRRHWWCCPLIRWSPIHVVTVGRFSSKYLT